MDLNALQPGDSLPDFVRGPVTRTQLALFAGASADHNPIHLDESEATAAGLPGVIVHGMLSMAILGQMLTHVAPQERIRDYTARFKAMAFPGDRLTCKGAVTGRSEVDGETVLDFDIRAENQKGDAILEGTARIAV